MSDLLVAVLLLIYFVVTTYTFRFQRTTLSLSREILGFGSTDVQVMLTPNWMGVLGWAGTALLVLNVVLVFIAFGWVYSLLLIFYAFVLGALVDAITPLPSYTHTFNIIERHLEQEARRAIARQEAEKLTLVEKMREHVRSSRSKHGI